MSFGGGCFIGSVLLGLILFFGGIVTVLVTVGLNLAFTVYSRKQSHADHSFWKDFFVYLPFPSVLVLGFMVFQIAPEVDRFG